jgi:hypothetical protein
MSDKRASGCLFQTVNNPDGFSLCNNRDRRGEFPAIAAKAFQNALVVVKAFLAAFIFRLPEEILKSVRGGHESSVRLLLLEFKFMQFAGPVKFQSAGTNFKGF